MIIMIQMIMFMMVILSKVMKIFHHHDMSDSDATLSTKPSVFRKASIYGKETYNSWWNAIQKDAH